MTTLGTGRHAQQCVAPSLPLGMLSHAVRVLKITVRVLDRIVDGPGVQQ